MASLLLLMLCIGSALTTRARNAWALVAIACRERTGLFIPAFAGAIAGAMSGLLYRSTLAAFFGLPVRSIRVQAGIKVLFRHSVLRAVVGSNDHAAQFVYANVTGIRASERD